MQNIQLERLQYFQECYVRGYKWEEGEPKDQLLHDGEWSSALALKCIECDHALKIIAITILVHAINVPIKYTKVTSA